MHFSVGELRAAQRTKADNIGALPDKADFVRPNRYLSHAFRQIHDSRTAPADQLPLRPTIV
jgi:hypothetical protein